MKNKTLDINGHIVELVNVCAVTNRNPGAKDMLRVWQRERIMQHLKALPEDEREALRKELNELRGRNGN